MCPIHINSDQFFFSDKNTDSFKFLIRANDTSELIWEFYIKYVKLLFSINGLGCIISTYISCIINGHFDTIYVIHMSKIVAPWNQTTLAGYLAEDFYIFFIAIIFSIVAGLVLLLYISICIYHSAFHKMIKHSIEKWNQNFNRDRDRDRNDDQFVFDLMRFHIEKKK